MNFLNIARGALGKSGSLLDAAGARMIGKSSGMAGFLGGLGVGGAGRSLIKTAGMGNLGLSAMLGASAGATYGMFSSDTSMVGGALKGAALGVGMLGASRLGGVGMRAMMSRRASGAGWGQAAAAGLNRMGRFSSRFIGRTSRRAVNSFRALGK